MLYLEPTAGSQLQSDGSYLQALPDGTHVRWSRRSDGSWRKPERLKVLHKHGNFPVAGDILAGVSRWSDEETDAAMQHPPATAELQPDGRTFDQAFARVNGSPRRLAAGESKAEVVFQNKVQEKEEVIDRSGDGKADELEVKGQGAISEGHLTINYAPRTDLIRPSPFGNENFFVGTPALPPTPVTNSTTKASASFIGRPTLHTRSESDRVVRASGSPGNQSPQKQQRMLAAPEVAAAMSSNGPLAEAILQGDGTYTLELRDGSSLRWTRRPDGTWRKPERKRAGWVGDLEQEKYVPPYVRTGEVLLTRFQ
eukprot:TRINITY_DN40768_c0_g2_i1.p1 TRINITY_DN40768_c0_g2~~TRINITY_DN40768_c0_g2_i1.p1  ORF type:complete len:311 (+),score=52.26 TRINITY_DN40768_c0_g2_i1:106-1038(+)